MNERRFEGRFLCADLAKLNWSAGNGRWNGLEAVLEDISSAGGCVQVEEDVPLGSIVRLEIGQHVFEGEVCYCNYRDCGYFVGLRFNEGCAWSAEEVRPRHLTNLEFLLRKAAG